MAIRLAFAAILLAFMPFAVAAQSVAPAQSGQTVKISNPIGTDSIPVLIARVINAFLGIVGSIAFLMFVWGGFNWLISGGSSEKIEKGKKAMTYAVIGMIIVFSSYALVRFVLGAFTTL